MKKIISLLLCVALLSNLVTVMSVDKKLWSRVEPGENFVTIRLHYPNGDQLTWAETQNLMVVYADTGEPVALCSGYLWGGWMFATVPAKEAGRPLEIVIKEPVRFEDCIKVWKETEYNEAPLGTEQLNVRGLFFGNGNGKLYPNQVITRAEAFAVICRMLSLQPAGNPGFSDVTEADWYYETASAAKAAGITNEPIAFRPNDVVTRGEFTVMLYRAMKTVGWITETTEGDTYFVDEATIPAWAKEAYCAFAAHSIDLSTVRESNVMTEFGADMERVAEYQKGALRGEVITFIYNTLRFLPVYPNDEAIAYGFDKTMPVIDGSTSTKPYTDAVYGALFNNYRGHPQYPKTHSKSYRSYERLISGEADILFAATTPSKDTMEQAKAAGVELEAIPIAYDAMVFFTNRENAIENITTEQIKSIYVENAHTNWADFGGPNAQLIPYCRNKDSGSQSLMEQFFLGEKDVHPDIRRETTSYSMQSVLTDVQDALVTNPSAYALGYSIYYYYEQARWTLLYPVDSLKLLAIDGVLPSDETIANGSYPLSGYNYAVIRADAPKDSPARKMVEFMLSEVGQTCVHNAGYGPLVVGLTD